MAFLYVIIGSCVNRGRISALGYPFLVGINTPPSFLWGNKKTKGVDEEKTVEMKLVAYYTLIVHLT